MSKSAETYLARTQPMLALKLAPDNVQALNAVASAQSLTRQNNPATLREAKALAQRSLLAQPLNPAALRVIGWVDNATIRQGAGLKPMAVASLQSRRDVMNQLWLMTRAISEQDIGQALVHFDAAARVSPEVWPLLFPPMIIALNDSKFADLFEPYLGQNNPWIGDFTRQAIRLSDRPVVIAALLSRGDLPKTAEFRGLIDELARKLTYGGQFDALIQLYNSQGGNPASVLTEASLTPATVADGFTPVRWLLDTEDGAEIDLSKGASRPRIYIVLARTASNVPASKFMTVREGRYRFSASGEFLRPPAGAEFQWRVRCWTDGAFRIIWQSPALTDDQHSVSEDIIIPQGCGGALIELLGKGPVNDVDAEYVVNSVDMDRLN
ncbi:hypothetical protein GV829_10305 [Sphingomonas lacunae]|uniref:Uncharacterized protein n=1 Tax=Sphingomonas lacunae TaxID=2698828 RepID=A0A6M4AUH3_9SPHN|nr:hypothetical protein [Sphingomonas lacunae]QJQ32788.1 hypothetical protein GV829_10305 [Sphingomonas lacunae]